jgi:hypothetical protein
MKYHHSKEGGRDMLCPHCGFEGSIFNGKCMRCNASIVKADTSSSSSNAGLYGLSNPYRLMRGDMLFHRRYRLVNQIPLPETQRDQGTAWLAIDTQASNLQVVLREIIVPRASIIAILRTRTVAR